METKTKKKIGKDVKKKGEGSKRKKKEKNWIGRRGVPLALVVVATNALSPRSREIR